MEELLSSLSGFEPVIAVALALAVALVAARVIRTGVARLFSKVPGITQITTLGRNPLRLALGLIGTRIALNATAAGREWFDTVDYVLVLALIASLAWLAIVVLLIIEAVVLTKYSTDTKDNRRLRRLKTQVTLGRRIAVAGVVVLGVASVLLTIPEVQALGAGILASAGVVSIVAGLAVQSTLGNVFAGIQIAFTDSIRVDDVVVVEGQWGTIEEITMTYVVVHIWDDRRLILPSTYFTTTPFENWTRRQSAILGTVELDVDWRVPAAELRAKLAETLEGTELWDGRTGVLQITDAVASLIRVRILVSAADSGALFDLRCLVRETMVTYLQQHHPSALPRQRWEQVRPEPARRAEAPEPDAGSSSMFTGSLDAVNRGRAFAGPGDDVFEERGQDDVVPSSGEGSSGRR